ncbi:alpha/beta-hydrolase [Calocera cornea HHB12733]|uniref:Alpha/beta-hydrolase n=1 Tax=Calocera cornea HHB12733 TaxID=1353952 RepID=A0A165ET92_9BASI|nr:alpha/beta-hydrolase [Calocera cornea HHB12733]
MQLITPFRYRSLPWTILYLSMVIPSTLLIRLPWYSLKYLLPAGRPRKSWPFSRALIVSVIRVFCYAIYDTGFQFTTTDPTIAPKDWEKKGWVSVPPASGAIQGEILELARKNKIDTENSISGYWFGERGADGKAGQPAAEGEKVVLYFHSGGYVMGTATDGLATAVVSGLLSIDVLFTRVFSLEYHVAKAAPWDPAAPWPTQLIEGVAGFSYLVSIGFKPHNILLCGDSSGGHMAFAVGHYLVKHPETALGSPGGLLLLSPTMDFTVSSDGPDSSFEKNQATDGLAAIFQSQYTVSSLRGEMSAEEFAADPLCSPGALSATIPKGFFTGMPKTFIHGCDGELALDSVVTFRDRMWEDNDKKQVQYVETANVTHDLLATPWQEPERRELLGDIEVWLQNFEAS